MLVVLRMNRKFMEFMRTHYSHKIPKPTFGRTVIDPDGQEEEGRRAPASECVRRRPAHPGRGAGGFVNKRVVNGFANEGSAFTNCKRFTTWPCL